MIRHLLPMGPTVRALRSFLRSGLRHDNWVRSIVVRPRHLEPAWHARYEPGSHVALLESEGRSRVYTFLLMTLRAHAAVLSRPPRLDRCRDMRARKEKEWRLGTAVDAMGVIGDWWDSEERKRRPHPKPAERAALDLCARIRRMKERSLEYRGAPLKCQDFIRAMKWMTERLGEIPRKGRGSAGVASAHGPRRRRERLST